jgi:hypothetical protein
MIFLWKHEGLEDVKVIQDFIKTIAQTNITVSFGFCTILIAIATLVSKRFDQMVNGKQEFMSLILAKISFIFTQLIALTFSYSTILSSNFIMIPYIVLSGIILYFIVQAIINLSYEILQEEP